VFNTGEGAMKIISILQALSTATPNDDSERRALWLRDPLAHPDLDMMSERELADLPFARGARSSCAESCRT
jgi:hypothetical protein